MGEHEHTTDEQTEFDAAFNEAISKSGEASEQAPKDGDETAPGPENGPDADDTLKGGADDDATDADTLPGADDEPGGGDTLEGGGDDADTGDGVDDGGAEYDDESDDEARWSHAKLLASYKSQKGRVKSLERRTSQGDPGPRRPEEPAGDAGQPGGAKPADVDKETREALGKVLDQIPEGLREAAKELAYADSPEGDKWRKAAMNYDEFVVAGRLETHALVASQNQAQAHGQQKKMDEHLARITAAHPEVGEAVQSEEAFQALEGRIAAWAEGMSYKDGQEVFRVWTQGKTEEVIEMLAKFKQATSGGGPTDQGGKQPGKKKPKPRTDKAAADAAAAVPARGAADIPGGKPDPDDFEGAWAEAAARTT